MDIRESIIINASRIAIIITVMITELAILIIGMKLIEIYVKFMYLQVL